MDEMPDISAGIGRLLEDPEMLGKALNVATALKNSGMLDGLFSSAGNNDAPSDSEKEKRQTYSTPSPSYTEKEIPEHRAALAPMRQSAEEQGAWNHGSAQRKALLLALRPYMSRERQERIDTVLRILELLDLAGKLGNGKL